MGKTSLANTFSEFLKSPTKDSKPVLTKGTALEFTKVMQLYDGLSVDQKTEIEVQVEDFPKNESVKLVKLKMDHEERKKEVTSIEEASGASSTKEGTGSPLPKTSKPTLEVSSSPSAPQKAGKRERFKKIFAPLFTRANEKPADASGEKSDDKAPARGENKNDVQLKLVDMGGHSATVV